MTRTRLTKPQRIEQLIEAGVTLTKTYGDMDWTRAQVGAACADPCGTDNVKRHIKLEILKALVKKRMGE